MSIKRYKHAERIRRRQRATPGAWSPATEVNCPSADVSCAFFASGCALGRRNRTHVVVDFVSEGRFRLRRELCVIRVENASKTAPGGGARDDAIAEACHRDVRVDR